MTKTFYDTAMIVGARPNFVKVAPLLSHYESNNHNVLFIHTGQHWDKNMSDDIFTDIGLRQPDINLNIKSDSMNRQLGEVIIELDKYINAKNTGNLFIFGDVTSTLAGAVVAKNNNIDAYHVEAGLRSGNFSMPEERNRIMVDSICDRLFTPSKDAVNNLLAENISPNKISNVGNIMIDTLVKNYEKIISNQSFNPLDFNIEKDFFVLTIHRQANLSDKNLKIIFEGLKNFVKDYDIVIPAHPRLKKYIESNKISTDGLKIINPLPYVKFLSLVYNSSLCLTDSGGLQEETTYLNKKCLTLREETERPITVESGTNKVIGVNKNIIDEINNSLNTKLQSYSKIELWDGKTSERIYQELNIEQI